jgi:hypothetical protein
MSFKHFAALSSGGPPLAQDVSMTLLAAVKEKDSILIGADSMVHHNDSASQSSSIRTGTKLYRLNGTNVVWGYCGMESIGEPLRLNLATRQYHGWGDLISAASVLICHLNQSSARIREELTSVLLAGYFKDDGRIVHLGPFGAESGHDDEYCFVGNGSVPAEVGYRLVRASYEGEHRDTALHASMEQTATVIRVIGGPFGFWRTTETSADPLKEAQP